MNGNNGTPDATPTKGPGKFIADVWRVPSETLPPVKRLGVRVIRFAWCFVRGFQRNQCTQQASALTYITLMSLVPVLAVGFSVAKGLGAHEKIKMALHDQMAAFPESATTAINKLFEAVDKVNFATLGTIGLALLFWTVVNTMTQVENSFNRIWCVSIPRTWVRRFQAYLSIILVVPIFMLVSTSVTAALKSQKVDSAIAAFLGVEATTSAAATLAPEPFSDTNGGTQIANSQEPVPLTTTNAAVAKTSEVPGHRTFLLRAVRAGFNLLGMSSVIIALGLLYMFMPNTRVHPFSALAGGAVAGIAWYVTQVAFVTFQVGVAKNNAIYGTFAAIPFFLMWVYSAWVIVLAGAQFCYVFQNRMHLRFIVEPPPLSFARRETLALMMTEEICTSVAEEKGAWNAVAFAKRNKLPTPMVRDILLILARGGLITETALPDRFVPVRDIHELTPADVERVLRDDVADSKSPIVLELPESAGANRFVTGKVAGFHDALRQTSFADLVKKS